MTDQQHRLSDSPHFTLIVKLASVAVHAEEALSPNGHDLDREAIKGLMANEDVRAAMSELGDLYLLPVKR